QARRGDRPRSPTPPACRLTARPGAPPRSSRIDAPCDPPSWMDPDDPPAHARSWRILILEGLGASPDLDPADPPRLDRCKIVDDQRDLATGSDVLELAGLAQIEPADVDRASVRGREEPDRAVLGSAVRVHRRKPAKAL